MTITIKLELNLKLNSMKFKRSFIKWQTSGIFSDKEWYNKWQRMTTSGTASDDE